MKITEALLGEHGVFYAQFEHLEKVVPQMEGLLPLKMQAALLAAALKPHAQLENELLFRAMESHLPSDSGPLAVMRIEHEEIEGTLERLQEMQELAEAKKMIAHAIHTAREHFAKEEQVLFPMANQMLDTRMLEQLGAKWAVQRKVRV
jgi:hemerythrin-like domain-containing protein